jgi:glycerophosphoryl diester phosphodiesterase
MIILSHRGYWKTSEEKNTIRAFERSFSMGFGTETDIRDYRGELVISHDIADEKSIKLEDFLQMYKSCNRSLPLALNIKADGLQLKLKSLLVEYNIETYFVFDMSVPDGLLYLKHNQKAFTRESEYEIMPSFYDLAEGVWMDEIHSHWVNTTVLQKHISNGKKVCIVSPDLHNREYTTEWNDYKTIENELGCNDIMICTDYPEEARRFFDD